MDSIIFRYFKDKDKKQFCFCLCKWKNCIFAPGEMAEWSIAAVLKTVEGNTSGGSNPSFSAEPHKGAEMAPFFGFYGFTSLFFAGKGSSSTLLHFFYLDEFHRSN